MRPGRMRLLACVALAVLLVGGAALAGEGEGSGSVSDSVYGSVADSVYGTGGVLPGSGREEAPEGPGVADAVYEAPCEGKVGGVTVQVPACNRVTRHAVLPVRFPDLPAGTVVSIGVHRPGRPLGRGFLVQGDGTTKTVRLPLMPGINVITVEANNDVRKYRVIRVGPGHRLRTFRDVAGKHWARGLVDKLAANGVFDGYLDGDSFEPDRPATRGDVAAFLDRIVNVDPGDGAGTVPGDARRHKAAKAIGRVVRQGLMKGVGQGRFAPDKTLTRAELATLLDRALPPVRVDVSVEVEFKDGGKVPVWARDAMARMRARGLLSGYADGTLRPDHRVTRAELAAMLARFMEYRDAGGGGGQESAGE